VSDCRKEAVERIVSVYGTYRAAGESLGIDHSYLWRIANGQKEPSENVMKKLNLKREVNYMWRKP
jgi:hypothetical protein